MQLFNAIFTPSKRASRVFTGSFETAGYSFMAHGIDIKRVNKAWYSKDKNRKVVDSTSHCPTLLFHQLRNSVQVKAADRVAEQLRKVKGGMSLLLTIPASSRRSHSGAMPDQIYRYSPVS